MYSINHLKKKNDIVTDLTIQQRKYNEAADKYNENFEIMYNKDKEKQIIVLTADL
jgi:predicted RNA-binding protein with PIN domain